MNQVCPAVIFGIPLAFASGVNQAKIVLRHNFLPKEFLGVFCPIIINCADLADGLRSAVASLSLHARSMAWCDSVGLAECQNSIHH